VDFSALDTLMTSAHTISSLRPEDLQARAELIRRSAVLVGDVKSPAGSDVFRVPGRFDLVPGVYIHASAVYTLSQAPLLYLKKGKRHDVHDVDNRLKDILDALQGRFGGPKSRHPKYRLIKDDRQVSRVVVEKQPVPKSLSDDAGGRLLIRVYERRRWPLQRSQGDQFFKRRKRGSVR